MILSAIQLIISSYPDKWCASFNVLQYVTDLSHAVTIYIYLVSTVMGGIQGNDLMITTYIVMKHNIYTIIIGCAVYVRITDILISTFFVKLSFTLRIDVVSVLANSVML